jgi:hypothetical protein
MGFGQWATLFTVIKAGRSMNEFARAATAFMDHVICGR